MRLVVVLTVLGVLCQVARADDAGDKSPEAALALSLVPTVVGVGLGIGGAVAYTTFTPSEDPPGVQNFAGGSFEYRGLGVGLAVGAGVALLVGPSLGHAYAGKVWTRGLKLRVGGLVAGGLLGLLARDSEGATAAIVIGGVPFVIGAGIEIATAPSAVREHDHQLSIVPAPITTPTGRAPAVHLGFAF